MLQKGLNGERKLDYHLLLLRDDYSVINDISFKYQNAIFQIDSLIISDYAIYIIDSKSIQGEITFQTNLEQLIQTYHNKEKSFKYPITQLENIKFQLMQWLERRKISGLPIYYFVSIADSSTILKVIGDENYIRRIVTFAENIPFFIMRKNSELEKQYKPQKRLRNRIVSTIMNEYKDLYIDLAKQYSIHKNEILPGVVCKKCYLLKTTYKKGTWTCSHCGYKDRTGYVRALRDYFILFGDGISNKEARRFLRVPYRTTVTRILKRSNLVYKKESRKWYKSK